MPTRDAIVAVLETVLFETEAADIVLAGDKFDAAYLCALAEMESDNSFYVAVTIQNGRLVALRQGAVDRRTILMEPESLPYFTVRM